MQQQQQQQWQTFTAYSAMVSGQQQACKKQKAASVSWLGNWKQLCDVARMELATVFFCFSLLLLLLLLLFLLRFVVSSRGACGNWNVKCALACVLRHSHTRLSWFSLDFPLPRPGSPVPTWRGIQTGLNGLGAGLSASADAAIDGFNCWK